MRARILACSKQVIYHALALADSAIRSSVCCSAVRKFRQEGTMAAAARTSAADDKVANRVLVRYELDSKKIRKKNYELVYKNQKY